MSAGTPAPTLGVEEEFLLVDAGTGAPWPDAEDVRRRAEAVLGEGVDHELRAAMVETGSAVCPDLATVAVELERRRRVLVGAAADVGARVVASASHPTASPEETGTTPDRRYDRMVRDFGPMVAEALVCGCHVHVAVPDRAAGVAVVDRVRPWLAPLLALSANSPLWHGRDTGYASWRTQVWSRFPSAGPTGTFGGLAAYDERADLLVALGAAVDRAGLYFDARLSERWPTVEVRVADVCLDAADAVLLGGLVRALVVTALADARGGGRPTPDLPVEALRAATWRASRYGVRGALVDPVELVARPAAAVLERLCAHVREALEEAGDRELVEAGVQRVLDRGTGADRRREALRAGGPPAVLDLVALG